MPMDEYHRTISRAARQSHWSDLEEGNLRLKLHARGLIIGVELERSQLHERCWSSAERPLPLNLRLVEICAWMQAAMSGSSRILSAIAALMLVCLLREASTQESELFE